MARHCAVNGCPNGDFRLNRWHKEICEMHKEKHAKPPCICKPPFKLYTFPTEKKDPEARNLWCKLINRTSAQGSQSIWTPGKKSRICSVHFIDGEPTKENPHPTLSLGYAGAEERVSKLLGKKRKTRTSTAGIPSARPKKILKTFVEGETASSVDNDDHSVTVTDCHPLPNVLPPVEADKLVVCDDLDMNKMPIIMTFLCYAVIVVMKLLYLLAVNNANNFVLVSGSITSTHERKKTKKITYENIIIKYLIKQLQSAQKLNKKLSEKCNKCTCQKPLRVNESILKTDKKVLFYTGIPNLVTFNKLCDFISPFVERKWRGAKLTSKRVQNPMQKIWL